MTGKTKPINNYTTLRDMDLRLVEAEWPNRLLPLQIHTYHINILDEIILRRMREFLGRDSYAIRPAFEVDEDNKARLVSLHLEICEDNTGAFKKLNDLLKGSGHEKTDDSSGFDRAQTQIIIQKLPPMPKVGKAL